MVVCYSPPIVCPGVEMPDRKRARRVDAEGDTEASDLVLDLELMKVGECSAACVWQAAALMV